MRIECTAVIETSRAVLDWTADGGRRHKVILHRRAVLFDLAENPGIRRRHAADHDCIASSLRDHGAGVLRRADVAIADHRNLYRILDGGDPFPASLTAITHLASAGVQSDRGQTAIFGHAS